MRAQPPTFHATRRQGDHTSGIHPNSPSPRVDSTLCSRSDSPALQTPWPHDLAPDTILRPVSWCQDPLLQFTCLSSYPFNSASCLDRGNTCCVLLRHPLHQSQLPGDPLPQLPAQRTQDQAATIIEFKGHGDGVPPTWATKSWNSSGRIHERG